MTRKVITPEWSLFPLYNSHLEYQAGSWSIIASNKSKMPAFFEPLEVTLRSSDSRVDIVDLVSSKPGLINPGEVSGFTLNLTYDGIQEEIRDLNEKNERALSGKSEFDNLDSIERRLLGRFSEVGEKALLARFFDPALWKPKETELLLTVEFVSGKKVEKITLDLAKSILYGEERKLRRNNPYSFPVNC